MSVKQKNEEAKKKTDLATQWQIRALRLVLGSRTKKIYQQAYRKERSHHRWRLPLGLVLALTIRLQRRWVLSFLGGVLDDPLHQPQARQAVAEARRKITVLNAIWPHFAFSSGSRTKITYQLDLQERKNPAKVGDRGGSEC